MEHGRLAGCRCHGEVADGEERLAGWWGGRVGRERGRGGESGAFGKHLPEGAPDHMADDEGNRGFGSAEGRDTLAVAEHGDPVGDGEDLLEFVRNIDAGSSSSAEAAQMAEEAGGFLAGERGGGFVEDEDAGIFVDGADDLDELFLTDAQCTHGCFGREGESEIGQKGGGAAVEFRPIDPQATPRSPPQEDIFSDAQLIDEGKFLGDDGDPGRGGVTNGVKGDDAAVDEEFALVGSVRMNAGEKLDERRFTGAIFSAEGVNFSGEKFEIDAIERDDPGEVLDEGTSGEDGGHAR